MPAPLEILMLSESSYPRHPGGAGKCSHLLAAGLAARGHTVHLVSDTVDETVEEEIDGVRVHRLRRLDTSGLAEQQVEGATAEHFLAFLESTLPLERIDLVHDSGGFLSYFFPLELALKERYGLPLVLHFRYLMIRHRIAETPEGRLDLLSDDFLGFESFLHIHSQGFPVRFADRVVALSSDDGDFVAGHYRPEPDRLRILPDPVVMREVDRQAVAAKRRELAGEAGADLVLFGGRIGDERFKGTDVVRAAFGKLLRARPHARLVLATRDRDAVEGLRGELGEAVIEVGWIDDGAALAALLAAVDLVWMPSRYEPFGLMCAEAMAVGTPVIAAPTGGLAEMVEHGRSGLLLSRGSAEGWPEELARLTANLLGDPRRREAMGEAARRRARENLSLEIVAEQVEALYRELLGEPTITGIGMPRWSENDSVAYLDLLGSRLGPGGRRQGERVLAAWSETVAERCRACTHAHLAGTLQRLKRQGGGRWGRLLGGRASRGQRIEAVDAVCPLALRQKEQGARLG